MSVPACASTPDRRCRAVRPTPRVHLTPRISPASRAGAHASQPPPPAPVVTGGAIVAGGSPAVTSSASLAAQAALAASFYAAQSYLAVAATRDILQVWQALNLRDVRQSWPALRTALAALIRDRHGQAAQLGTGYYQQARRAAGILTEAPRIVVPPPPEPQITATLDSMGPWNLLGKIKQGQQVATANENTGVQLSGAAQRLITNGARQAVLESVEADPEAVGGCGSRRRTRARFARCYRAAVLLTRRSEASRSFRGTFALRLLSPRPA